MEGKREKTLLNQRGKNELLKKSATLIEEWKRKPPPKPKKFKNFKMSDSASSQRRLERPTSGKSTTQTNTGMVTSHPPFHNNHTQSHQQHQNLVQGRTFPVWCFTQWVAEKNTKSRHEPQFSFREINPTVPSFPPFQISKNKTTQEPSNANIHTEPHRTNDQVLIRSLQKQKHVDVPHLLSASQILRKT